MRFTIQTYDGPPDNANSSRSRSSFVVPPRRRSVDTGGGLQLSSRRTRRRASLDVRLLHSSEPQRRRIIDHGNRNNSGSDSDDEDELPSTSLSGTAGKNVDVGGGCVPDILTSRQYEHRDSSIASDGFSGGSGGGTKVHFSDETVHTETEEVHIVDNDDEYHGVPYIPDASIQSCDASALHGARFSMAASGRCLGTTPRRGRRLVYKDGNCNISTHNVTQRKRKYLFDIFTTLLDMRWRYNILLFAAAFVVSWIFFAVLWFLVAYAHSDTLHPPEEHGETWQPCVSHVYDFPTAFLFSLETQTTIGYGYCRQLLLDTCMRAQ